MEVIETGGKTILLLKDSNDISTLMLAINSVEQETLEQHKERLGKLLDPLLKGRKIDQIQLEIDYGTGEIIDRLFKNSFVIPLKNTHARSITNLMPYISDARRGQLICKFKTLARFLRKECDPKKSGEVPPKDPGKGKQLLKQKVQENQALEEQELKEEALKEEKTLISADFKKNGWYSIRTYPENHPLYNHYNNMVQLKAQEIGYFLCRNTLNPEYIQGVQDEFPNLTIGRMPDSKGEPMWHAFCQSSLRETPDGGVELHISTLCAMEGSKLGGLVLKSLQETIQDAVKMKMKVTLDSVPGAVGFYEKQGFKRVFPPSDEDRSNLVKMIKDGGGRRRKTRRRTKKFRRYY